MASSKGIQNVAEAPKPTVGYIINKSTRAPAAAYAGPSCLLAGVPAGKVYTSLEAAEYDAELLTSVNPIGFVVIKHYT